MKPLKKSDIPRGSETILIVDDDKAILYLCKLLVESLGYFAVTELCPKAALSLFAERPYRYDLVITDYEMMPFNGGKLASAISQIRSDIPIIAYTGNPASARNHIVFSDVIVKPASIKDIALKIRHVLDPRKVPMRNIPMQSGA
jgi:CheY-like chemotaxis protein